MFNLDESHAIFENEGIDAYCRHQIEREDIPLKPGVAFSLVKKLLALNKRDTVNPRVEVILLSRNSADTGLRIFNSIQLNTMGWILVVQLLPEERARIHTFQRSVRSYFFQPNLLMYAMRWKPVLPQRRFCRLDRLSLKRTLVSCVSLSMVMPYCFQMNLSVFTSKMDWTLLRITKHWKQSALYLAVDSKHFSACCI